MSMPPFNNPFRESRLNNELDYRPEWDVLSLNDSTVKVLVQEIRRAQGHDKPNPAQLIPVILAAAGYGKTHLFGRISHELESEMFFVYVPGIEDLSRPLEHIGRHAVESLFRTPPGKPSVLAHALARLFQPSLQAYVSKFPPSLSARFQGLALSLQDSAEKAHEIAVAVKELSPFLRLASSLADRMPHLSRDVLRALVLGWSPAAHFARRWLKGENLPEEDRERLGFGEEPPPPLDVLQGIAAILQYRTPIVICCDQLEFLTTAGADQINQLTARLMGILEKVPNHVLILSCLRIEWEAITNKSFQSFLQRLRKPELILDPIRDQQGMELVSNRLKDWPGGSANPSLVWPFDEAALLTYIQKKRPTPRALIQKCAGLLDGWFENRQEGLICLGADDDGLDGGREFLRLWNGALEKIRQDPACEPEDYAEDRLYRAVRAAFQLARESLRDMGGVRVHNIQEGAIKQGTADKRVALVVDVSKDGKSFQVVVPVTVLNNSRKFQHYFAAVRERIQRPVIGALLVHRQSEFDMGSKTQEVYDELVEHDLIRVFALEENRPSFERLECLLRFLDSAVSQELLVAGRTLSLKDCQAYILETAVLDNLDLFRALGSWPSLGQAQKPTISPKPPPAAAAATGAEKVAAVAGVASGSGRITGTLAPSISASWPPQPPPIPLAPGPLLSVVAPPPVSKAAPETVATFQAKYEQWAREKLELVTRKLTEFGQPVKPDGVEIGPAFGRLRVIPSGRKTTINRIRDRAEDLKIHLGLDVEPMIDSQASHVSIDVQLPDRRRVTLDQCLTDLPDLPTTTPTFPVGVDVSGKAHWLDLSDTSDCHLLVAGQTGSGKSEFLRSLCAALARRISSEQLKFVLIDPKRVTFNLGSLESPYLKFPVALDAEGALPLLQWCMEETKERYAELARQKKVNIGQIEDTSLIPRIVVVIDEFANLLEDRDTKPILNSLLRQIGSMARAAGIHLVLATQRPDKDVITPLLKSNLPGRVALQVSNEANSKLILGAPSAAYLLGKGDLLWPHRGGLLRLQSPFVDQNELEEALQAH